DRNKLLDQMQSIVDRRAEDYLPVEQGIMDHSFEKHRAESNRQGTHLPPGITRDKFMQIARHVHSLPRVQPLPGDPDPALVRLLDAGHVTLYEFRQPGLENLYAVVDGVRYELRLGRYGQTFHPIDGVGVTAHYAPPRGTSGTGARSSLPMGSRPVNGWNRPRN
ncbi:MAG: hypothetical protein LBH11_03330, partial [Propionibacteriaceae bacterium]|nr:hypothetical protein [Propionibacteriaceae bacterium]